MEIFLLILFVVYIIFLVGYLIYNLIKNHSIKNIGVVLFVSLFSFIVGNYINGKDNFVILNQKAQAVCAEYPVVNKNYFPTGYMLEFQCGEFNKKHRVSAVNK